VWYDKQVSEENSASVFGVKEKAARKKWEAYQEKEMILDNR
jgi:hypothetical protein